MFESSFLSSVINFYHMLLNDLVGPTDDMLNGGTLLNCNNGIQIILIYKSKQTYQIYCEYVTREYGCLLRQEKFFPTA